MTIDEIKQRIAEDKNKVSPSYRRYPVRFVFVEMNNNTQDEILDLIKNTDGELLDLSDFIMKKDDGWMTKSRFVQIVKERASKEKDTYILGFSELIRFFSKKEIESAVLALFDIENQSTSDPQYYRRRIYLICFAMFDNVSNVIQKSFTRRDFVNPFINPDFNPSGHYREICFVSSDYSDNIKKNKITSSVEWIGLWRQSGIIDFHSPIWCCSENLYKWHQKASPDNAFQIDVVTNGKDYLWKAYDLHFDFPYLLSESDYWDKLKSACFNAKRSSTESMIVAAELGVSEYSSLELAAKYLTTDNPYLRWLTRNYVGAYMANSFLNKIFQLARTNSNKEFILLIWKQGYLINDKALLSERLSIIKELNKYSESFIPEKEIQEAILDGVVNRLFAGSFHLETINDINLDIVSAQLGGDVLDLRNRLLEYYKDVFKPAYTFISDTEKEFIIVLFSNNVIDSSEIKELYFSLYNYLRGSSEELVEGKDEWKKYVQSYRESKIAGKDNDFLKHYYESGVACSTTVYNMYYTIPHQETVVTQCQGDADLYVLDGVGVEYLSVLVPLIESGNYEIELCDYAVCHLPSITDVNKSYLSDLNIKEWIVSFDRDVIHGEFYKTSSNLRKAFDALERIIKDIMDESSGKRIVITSDHGATARAKWTETKKKYSFSNADHEGRCCEISNKSEYSDNEDYIVFEDETKPGRPFIISLNETSLFNRPRYEDHGGATPEEILVPVIIATPKEQKKRKVYKVIEEKLIVSGLDKRVSFTISPNPGVDVYIIESNGHKQIMGKDGSIYVADLQSGKEQNILLAVDGVEFKFRTKNKSKMVMEGDDGFDD